MLLLFYRVLTMVNDIWNRRLFGRFALHVCFGDGLGPRLQAFLSSRNNSRCMMFYKVLLKYVVLTHLTLTLLNPN